MKETVRQMQIGGYGNDGCNSEAKVKPINCRELVRKAFKMGNEKFIPLCSQLTGTLGNLAISGPPPPDGTVSYPINLVVSNLSANIEDK